MRVLRVAFRLCDGTAGGQEGSRRVRARANQPFRFDPLLCYNFAARIQRYLATTALQRTSHCSPTTRSWLNEAGTLSLDLGSQRTTYRVAPCQGEIWFTSYTCASSPTASHAPPSRERVTDGVRGAANASLQGAVADVCMYSTGVHDA